MKQLLCASALFFAVAPGCASQRVTIPAEHVPEIVDENAHSSVTLITAEIFFQSEQLAVEEFEVVRGLDPINFHIPFRKGEFGMIGIRCKRFSPDGYLENCAIAVAPKGVGYEAVGRELVEQLKTDPDYIRSLKLPIKFIDIQARVSNSDIPPADGPCWPPRCRPIPLPPPPAQPEQE